MRAAHETRATATGTCGRTRGLTDHRNNLNEYLVQLEKEREDLERELRELNRRIEANVAGWRSVNATFAYGLTITIGTRIPCGVPSGLTPGATWS